jgi:signal transduction histidine kinase
LAETDEQAPDLAIPGGRRLTEPDLPASEPEPESETGNPPPSTDWEAHRSTRRSHPALAAQDDADAPDRRSSPTGAAPPRDDARASDPLESGRTEISELITRIATYKRNRDAPVTDSDRSPRLPLGEFPQPRDRRIAQFTFATDAGGRIEWADSDAAPMVVGARLVAVPVLGSTALHGAIERAFSQRQPIIQAEAGLEGAPAISGEWIVDAQPRFSEEGNFTGYVGRFRRPVESIAAGSDRATREADRIRQLLHELRTPVTAVQGYAEVIQQQLFGPAPHEYRALAAEIAADGARILAGFEQLDRLARLEGRIADLDPGESDLASHARSTVRQLAQVLGPRMAGITLAIDEGAQTHVPLDAVDIEMILWRMLATLGGGCDNGEQLCAQLTSDADQVRLACDLPARLRDDGDIFTTNTQPVHGSIQAGLFGAGFALRLARAEASSAGGDLLREGRRIVLCLPLIDAGRVDDPQESATDEGFGLTVRGEGHSS